MPTTSPPILIWTPGGGTPVGGVSSGGPVYSQAGTTPLIEGQAYLDVVFGSIQTDDEWVLVECVVVNEIDGEDALNIWPGIITDKTQAGFRVYLNGLPDSSNYYLHWAVSGINITPSVASTYTLSGPSSGGLSVASTFTVALPPSTTVPGTLTVTPDDGGGGGAFTPASVALTTSGRTATFTYNPVSYGAKTISATNSGGLIDPASVAFTCVATGYTFTGPSAGSTGVASTDFSLELPVGGVVIGTVTVTPHDEGDGGTFTPVSVGLTTAAPSATFTYTPATDGTKTISVTNNGGLTNPGNISYVASTPFDPTSIAGLKLWLQADSLALSDGDPVALWSDSSANAYNLIAAGSARPTYKTNIVNGKPVVRFDGVANILQKITDISVPQPYTVFIVAKQTGFPIQTFVIYSSTACIVGMQATGHSVCYAGTLLEDSTDWHAAFHVFTCKISGGTGTLYVDQTQTATGAVGASAAGAIGVGGQAGGAQFYPCDVAEVILYNSALSNTDRVNVEAFLKDKYNTP